MFRFEHPEHLYALAILPVLLLVYFIAQYLRRRTLQRLGNPSVIARFMPQVSQYKYPAKFLLTLFAIALLCIAWANPQWGTKKEEVTRKSADIYLAIDISQSMLARDIKPSRLERAKQFAHKLIEAVKGNRVGLIIFAGNPYLQMPLTTDYNAAHLFVRTASPDLAPTPGTAISEALNLGTRLFGEDDEFHKALILITDGENHEEEALDAARAAKERGLIIFTIGVGTAEGAPIPTGTQPNAYKKGANGQIISSKLNEPMLRELALAGDGNYYSINNDDAVIAGLQRRIEQLEKQEFEQRSFTEYASYFQYFLIAALLLILLEFLISYRKNPWLAQQNIFGN